MDKKSYFSFRYVLVSLILLALADCQAATTLDGEKAAPANATQGPASPAPQGLPATGELETLQPVIDAILSDDMEARKELIHYTKTACTNADGLGGPPKCETGETEGDIVEAFPISGSEGSFARPESIDQVLGFQVSFLYAITRVPSGNNPEGYWPAGEIALLFEREENGVSMPITIRAEQGRIVRLDYHMGQSAAQVLEGIPADQILWQKE